MIDHHLVSALLAADYVESSAAVLHPVVPAYGTTTSDHYPVVSRYLRGSGVSIIEVLANEPGSDRGGESITLRGAADLSGWTLGDATAVRHVFPSGTTVDGTLTVFGREASSGTLSLNNAGDAAVLRDAAGMEIDVVKWSSAQDDGVALRR
jgi:hypothetical protein